MTLSSLPGTTSGDLKCSSPLGRRLICSFLWPPQDKRTTLPPPPDSPLGRAQIPSAEVMCFTLDAAHVETLRHSPDAGFTDAVCITRNIKPSTASKPQQNKESQVGRGGGRLELRAAAGFYEIWRDAPRSWMKFCGRSPESTKCWQ